MLDSDLSLVLVLTMWHERNPQAGLLDTEVYHDDGCPRPGGGECVCIPMTRVQDENGKFLVALGANGAEMNEKQFNEVKASWEGRN